MSEPFSGGFAALTPDVQADLRQHISDVVQETVNATSRPINDTLAALQATLERLGQGAPPAETSGSQAAPLTPGGSDARPAITRGKPLPNPPKFSGRRAEYTPWAQMMRDKIALDRRFYASNNELWYLINSCLDTQPQQVVATYYQTAGPRVNWNPDEFMAYLDRSYADYNEQARAAGALRTLRQRDDQPLAQFLPRFEKTIAQAGGGHWPDDARITFLEGALNPALRSSLVSATLPQDYTGWVNQVQLIAGRLEGLRTLGQRPPWNNKPPRRDAEGDIAMAGMNKLGDGRGHAARKPRASRDQGCFRCQQPGHFARDCRAPAPVPQESTRSAKVAPRRSGRASRPATPTLESDEDALQSGEE